MALENCKLKEQAITTHLLVCPKLKTLTTLNAGQDVKQLSFIADGNAKWYSHIGRQFGSFLQKQTYSYHVIQQSHSLVFTKGIEILCPHKNLHTDVYSSFIHDYQKLESNQDVLQ